MLFGAGALCLAVWLLLRKSTEPVNRKIASWTAHVWTEARFLLALICLVWSLLPGLPATDLFWAWRYDYFWDYGGASIQELARALLVNIPGLLALFWFVWLIRNDHRYTPKEARWSLLRPFFRGLRARDLKRPVEKRLSRRTALLILTVFLLGAEVLSILINLTVAGVFPAWLIWTVYLLPVLLASGTDRKSVV